MKRRRAHNEAGEVAKLKQARELCNDSDEAQVQFGHLHKEVQSRAGLDASILEALNVASRLEVESAYCVNSRCSWDVIEVGPENEGRGPMWKVFAARTSIGFSVHVVQHRNSAKSKLNESEVCHFRELHPNAFVLACFFALSSAHPTVVRELCDMQAHFLSESGEDMHVGAGQIASASESASENMRQALRRKDSVKNCLETGSLSWSASGVHGVVLDHKEYGLKDGVLQCVEKRRHVSVSVHSGEDGAVQLKVLVDGQPNFGEELVWSSFPALALMSQAIAQRGSAVVLLEEVSNKLAELPKEQQIDALLEVALRGDALTQVLELLGVPESERGGLYGLVAADWDHVRRLTLPSALQVSERLEASVALLEGQYVRAAVRSRGERARKPACRTQSLDSSAADGGAGGEELGEGVHMVAIRCVGGRLDLLGTHCDHAAEDGSSPLLVPCACAAAASLCVAGGRVLDAGKLRGLLELQGSGTLVQLALQLVLGRPLRAVRQGAVALAKLVEGGQARRPELSTAPRPLPALQLVRGINCERPMHCWRKERAVASGIGFAGPQPTLEELKAKVEQLGGCSGREERAVGEALALQLGVTAITAALRNDWRPRFHVFKGNDEEELGRLLDLLGRGPARVPEHRLAHAVLVEELRRRWCLPMAEDGGKGRVHWQIRVRETKRTSSEVQSVLRLLEQRGMKLLQAVVEAVCSAQSLLLGNTQAARDQLQASGVWARALCHLAAVVPGVALSADAPPKLSMPSGNPGRHDGPAVVELGRLPTAPAEFLAALSATLRLFYGGPDLVEVSRLLLAGGWQEAAGDAMVQAVRGYLHAGEGWPGALEDSELRRCVHTDSWDRREEDRAAEESPAGLLFGAALAWSNDERAADCSVQQIQQLLADQLHLLSVPLMRPPVRSSIVGLLTHRRGRLSRSAALGHVLKAVGRARSPAPLALLALELSPAAVEPACALMFAALAAMSANTGEQLSLVARCKESLHDFVGIGVAELCDALLAGGALQMACRVSELWCEALPGRGASERSVSEPDEDFQKAVSSSPMELRGLSGSWCEFYKYWLVNCRYCMERLSYDSQKRGEQRAVEAVVDSHLACGAEAQLLQLLGGWQQRKYESTLRALDLEPAPATEQGLRFLNLTNHQLSSQFIEVDKLTVKTSRFVEVVELTVKTSLEAESRTLTCLLESALSLDIHLGKHLTHKQIPTEHEVWKQRRERTQASLEKIARGLWGQAHTLQGLPSCGRWTWPGEALTHCCGDNVCPTCKVGCAMAAHSLALCRLAAALCPGFADQFRDEAWDLVDELLVKPRVIRGLGDREEEDVGTEHHARFHELVIAVADKVLLERSPLVPELAEITELLGVDLVLHEEGGEGEMDESEEEQARAQAQEAQALAAAVAEF